MGAIAGPARAEYVDGLREIDELYIAQAVRVRRLVHLQVTAPDDLVEDACQVAWLRLLRHRTRVRRDTAERWVVRVAVHEALRAIARAARDVALDALEEEDCEPRTVPDLMQALSEGRERLRVIDALPARQQRLVWLQGLGFSYEEMAGATGESRRTVERQLLRAQRALADVAS
jgi:RNA polymerase sigma factor (sigma-70 family)